MGKLGRFSLLYESTRSGKLRSLMLVSQLSWCFDRENWLVRERAFRDRGKRLVDSSYGTATLRKTPSVQYS